VQDVGVLEAQAVLGSKRRLSFTRSAEHRPGGDGQIREHSNAGLDPQC
jgi:hypothetical protein